jgi:nitrate reductase gamma subunit
MNPNFLFVAWPYMALALFCLGIADRYLLSRKQMAAVEAKLPDAWTVFGGSKLWRISLVLLLLGHLVGWVFPRGILLWNGSTIRLYLLESFAFTVGVVALVSWAALMWRHLERSSDSAAAEFADTVFLALLFVGLLSGLLMAVFYRWGSSWGAMTLTPYAVSLLRASPTAGFVTQMPFLVRLHIFSWFAAVAVVPLTRLAAFIVLALHRCFGLMGRPVVAVGRAAEAWMQRHDPAARIWPEED